MLWGKDYAASVLRMFVYSEVSTCPLVIQIIPSLKLACLLPLISTITLTLARHLCGSASSTRVKVGTSSSRQTPALCVYPLGCLCRWEENLAYPLQCPLEDDLSAEPGSPHPAIYLCLPFCIQNHLKDRLRLQSHGRNSLLGVLQLSETAFGSSIHFRTFILKFLVRPWEKVKDKTKPLDVKDQLGQNSLDNWRIIFPWNLIFSNAPRAHNCISSLMGTVVPVTWPELCSWCVAVCGQV